MKYKKEQIIFSIFGLAILSCLWLSALTIFCFGQPLIGAGLAILAFAFLVVALGFI